MHLRHSHAWHNLKTLGARKVVSQVRGKQATKRGDKGGEGNKDEWANVGFCDGDSWLACREGT